MDAICSKILICVRLHGLPNIIQRLTVSLSSTTTPLLACQISCMCHCLGQLFNLFWHQSKRPQIGENFFIASKYLARVLFHATIGDRCFSRYSYFCHQNLGIFRDKLRILGTSFTFHYFWCPVVPYALYAQSKCNHKRGVVLKIETYA